MTGGALALCHCIFIKSLYKLIKGKSKSPTFEPNGIGETELNMSICSFIRIISVHLDTSECYESASERRLAYFIDKPRRGGEDKRIRSYCVSISRCIKCRRYSMLVISSSSSLLCCRLQLYFELMCVGISSRCLGSFSPFSTDIPFDVGKFNLPFSSYINLW